MRAALLLLLSAPLWAAATFTSVQSGNWNDPTTWGFAAGVCAYHSTCPAMTDGSDAGDTVLLGNLSHTVTCPTGVTCSAGNSPTSDAGAIALGAVDYTNTTASFAVAPGATFIYAGPVRQNNANWTIGAGAAMIYDSSWSSAPTTALYSWSTRNTSTGNGGRLTTSGTSGSRINWTIGNSASNAACAGNTCRTGPVGANASNHQSDSGTITCAYTDFSYLGSIVTSFSNYGLWLSIHNSDSSIDHCTFDQSNVINIAEAGVNGVGNLTITGMSITNSTVTALSTGVIGWTSLASSGVRSVSNSYIQGPWVTASSGYTASNLTMTNVVFRNTSIGVGVRLSSSYAPRFTSDQILMLAQGDTDQIYQTSSGDHTRWVHARYVNSGQSNMHPMNAPNGTGSLIRWHVFEGNLPSVASDYISPGATAQAGSGPIIFRDNIYPCKGDGNALGSFINFQGGAAPGVTAQAYQNTYCSTSVTNPTLSSQLTMGIGWEGNGTTFAANVIQRLDSNVVYQTSGPGIVEVSCTPADGTSGASASTGSVVEMGYNAVYNNNSGINYCSNVTANGHVTTGPTGDMNYARSPLFLDSTRKLITFDVAYLGHAIATAWAVGQSYSVGDILSDSQPAIYGGASFNWRMTSNTGGCATSSSSNRPYSGSAWVGCWEPASFQYILADVLAGNAHTDPTIGAVNLSMIGIVNTWIRAGYTPVGADALNLRSSGLGGIRVGAVDPVALAVAPTSLSFTCTSGGSVPGSQSVAVSVTGVGVTLDNWSATRTQTWLTLSPTSGSAAGSFSTTPNCSGLTPGLHTDTVTVASTTAGIVGSPITIPVSVVAVAGPAISTLSLPNGLAGTAYSQTLAAVGGQTPYTWSISAGTLCGGLSLNASTGAISGTPAFAGTCSFTARVTDVNSVSATQPLTITIIGVPAMTFRGVTLRGIR